MSNLCELTHEEHIEAHWILYYLHGRWQDKVAAQLMESGSFGTALNTWQHVNPEAFLEHQRNAAKLSLKVRQEQGLMDADSEFQKASRRWRANNPDKVSTDRKHARSFQDTRPNGMSAVNRLYKCHDCGLEMKGNRAFGFHRKKFNHFNIENLGVPVDIK